MTTTIETAVAPAFFLEQGMYTIKVESLDSGFYPIVMDGDELIWSGALTGDLSVAKNAAIRQYHLIAKDLIPNDDRIVKVDPSLLIPHPKNKYVYADDEETTRLLQQLDTEEGIAPYVSEYIVLKDGTIISGHRRNWVIVNELNPRYIKETGTPKIAEVPVIVREYASEADELEALIKENQYRENKSPEAKLNEAAVLLQIEYLRGLERKRKARQLGQSVPKEEQGRSIHIVAAKLGYGSSDLQNQLSINDFLSKEPELKDRTELVKLWKKVRDQATNTAVELRQIWNRDRLRDKLTPRHFLIACELLLKAGKNKLRASNAILQAKQVIAEEERKANEANAKPSSNKSGGSVTGTPPSAKSAPSGGGGAIATDQSSTAVVDGAASAVKGDSKTETAEDLESEVEGMHPESRDRWLEASEEQRAIWRLAKEARDIYGDEPANNRLSKRTELVDRCLEVIRRDEFDYDPFADLTNLEHIPANNYYTVKDNFLKKEGGKYVNPISGDVFANILWNQQKDCVQALTYWIEQGDVDRLFIVSQASITNLPTCQEIFKKHGFVVAEWGGRLEYEAGQILSYNCFFPKEGEPRKVTEGNQRYDTAVLFYSKDPEDKLRFEEFFNQVALVTFQREMVTSAAIDASEYLKLPVWIANECHWEGYKLKVQLDSDEVWTTWYSQDKEDEAAKEEEGEPFGTEAQAKAWLMSLVLLKKMERSPF